MLWSADNVLNPYRDRIVARTRDAVRNDGWASGAVTRVLDNAIGANFRPLSKPDYRALALYTGIETFDAVWADEYGRALEACWRTWANDAGRWCDAQRAMTVSQMFFLAFRHYLVDGDGLGILYWLPERVVPGAAWYATTLQVVDPDRLSNPQLVFDNQTLRGGVEVDGFGAAMSYWIRAAHQGDWWAAADSMHWEKIPRETPWGRPVVVHHFDHDQAAKHRGGAGILTPVLQRLKMLIKYDSSELDAAIINAIFGAYVESPFDPEMVQEALTSSDDKLGWYQEHRSEFHKDRNLMLGGARLAQLFPGEAIKSVTAARPTSNFGEFEGAVLRNVSAGTGLSAQQISNNWSDVNYSSARGALLEAWKTIGRRRHDFAAGWGQPIFAAFVEECMERGDLPLPEGAPDFSPFRTAYSNARWMGPGRGWIDPVAEAKGAVLRMDAGLSTLEEECAEQGLDWEATLDQRAREIEAFKKRGIPVPTWAGMNAGPPASQVAEDPPVT